VPENGMAKKYRQLFVCRRIKPKAGRQQA